MEYVTIQNILPWCKSGNLETTGSCVNAHPEDCSGGCLQEVGIIAGRHVLVEGVRCVEADGIRAVLSPQLLQWQRNGP